MFPEWVVSDQSGVSDFGEERGVRGRLHHYRLHLVRLALLVVKVLGNCLGARALNSDIQAVLRECGT